MDTILQDLERQILSVVEFSADMPVPEIAEKVGVPSHRVYHALGRLFEQGIVVRRAYCDSYRLGSLPFMVGVTLASGACERREELLTALRRHPAVSFVAEVSGSYDCWFELRAADVCAAEEAIFGLMSRFGESIERREVYAMPRHTKYPAFAEGKDRRTCIATAAGCEVVAIDAFDRKLLGLIAPSWMQSQRELAERLKVPTSTVSYRLQRLRDLKVLIGARLWVDFAKLGQQQYLHLLSFRCPSAALQHRLHSFALAEADVFMVRGLLGRWDVLIEAHHDSPAGVKSFTSRLQRSFRSELRESSACAVLAFSKTSDCTVLGDMKLKRSSSPAKGC